MQKLFLAKIGSLAQYLCQVRVGIFFGGASREREVSYAGGRTVYDMIDRRKFEPIPLFVEPFHRIVRLHPRYLYYGMISDFFPPPAELPVQIPFPLYAEQIWYPESSAYILALSRLGPIIPVESLPHEIDVAFLVLHGLGGEDGSIQGLLEQIGLPYTGTGIGSSAWGMDKVQQRQWLRQYGFLVPPYAVIPKSLLWEAPEAILSKVEETVGFPCVIKHPWQGSTIGVAVCETKDDLIDSLYQCAFIWPVRKLPSAPDGELLNLLDLRTGLSMPLLYRDRNGTARELITDWQELLHFLRRLPQQGFVEAWDSPPYLLVERFIQGEEFSVIVIETPSGRLVALPPTHIRKVGKVYDYRAKYLSGISSKQTPSPELPNEAIQKAAEKLACEAGIRVYARLDGIATSEGEIFFNDPNTTSGMLPASLLFQQAAEVGFTPTEFITYLIERSVGVERTGGMRGFLRRHRLTLSHREVILPPPPLRIAVIFGGTSSERHISLESGRNVSEKLASRYEVLPLFLHQREGKLELWRLPPRLLFKDNADDVAAALSTDEVPETVRHTRDKLSVEERFRPLLTQSYHAEPLPWEDLRSKVDFVFLALHGRPGEDGTVQAMIENLGLPYNGSPPSVCALLMDKYATQQYLKAGGFLVPSHYRVEKAAWLANPQATITTVEAHLGAYPYIAKPTDEGCSTGVRVIPDRETLAAYLAATFRETSLIEGALRQRLNILPEEPFPPKSEALIETYLHGPEWLEVTVGIITYTEGNKVRYEAFFPSETVKEEGILSLEEKFLAGAGQNITPARIYPGSPPWNAQALATIQKTAEQIAAYVGIHGYARIDGFVRRLGEGAVEFWTLEINALPGLTPATVFFHQAARAGYTPLEILEHIVKEGQKKARQR